MKNPVEPVYRLFVCEVIWGLLSLCACVGQWIVL